MTFALLGPVGYFAPKGLWIPILLIFIVHAGTLKTLTADDLKSLLGRNAVFLAVPCYALLSTLWAIEPAVAAKTSLKLFGYILSAILLVCVVQKTTDREKRSILMWSAVGLMFGPLIAGIDIASAGYLSGFARTNNFIASVYNRGAAIGAFCLLPVAVGLLRLSLRPLAVAFIVTTVMTIFILESEAAKLALVAGGAVYFLVRLFHKFYWPAIGIMLAVFVVTPALFSVNYSDETLCTISKYKFSAVHRLMIYNYSSQRIFEKPLAGWGMDSARSLPSGKGMSFIDGCDIATRSDGKLQIGNWMPLHPHNAALQTWLELGFIGVALIVGCLILLARRVDSVAPDRQARALFAGTLAGLFMVLNISFGFWQGWLMFGMVLLCALMSMTLRLGTLDPAAATGREPSGSAMP